MRGNSVEVQLPYQKEKLRIEIFGDIIERLEWVNKQNNSVCMSLDNVVIFPAKHFVTTQEKKDFAIYNIRLELANRLKEIDNPVYKERLERRVHYDLEQLEEMGYCSGIENYSVYFDGRKTGEPPYCLFNFFPKDFLFIIDESHVAVPQLRGMHAGDRSRKASLVEFGFRLPSAFDNRPLRFDEVEQHCNDLIFVSATPSDYELLQSDSVIEQIIRPTGIIDPEIFVHNRENQLEHLIEEIEKVCGRNERILITVLTKKLAEELARYLEEQKIKVCYLHSDIKTPKRTEILQKLRQGIFDCLVGVNLLREGLDLPEVSLVAIMDADIESYLRDKRSLIQTIGRAARNARAKVVMYADTITKSMRGALAETDRRRARQKAHNKKYNIIPQTVHRDITKSIISLIGVSDKKKGKKTMLKAFSCDQKQAYIQKLEQRMWQAAQDLDFEMAIALRNEWMELQKTKRAK